MIINSESGLPCTASFAGALAANICQFWWVRRCIFISSSALADLGDRQLLCDKECVEYVSCITLFRCFGAASGRQKGNLDC